MSTKSKNTKHNNTLTSINTYDVIEQETTLPDGHYLLTGMAHIEVKAGKPTLYDLVGCYQSTTGEQYLVDTTNRAASILHLFSDDIPQRVEELMLKGLADAQKENLDSKKKD